jgi:hypothetical protein
MWTRYRSVRDTVDPNRGHRPVHHRHGFVFGFPNCTAASIDERFDDSFND